MREKSVRRILYFVCFLAFNLIDFIRNTQNGDVWSTAANATGLVVMVLVFSAYPIREFLTVRAGIWTLACLGISFCVLLWRENFIFGVYKWAFLLAVWNVWWIFLVGVRLLCSLRSNRSWKVRPDGTGIAALLLALCMTFSASGRLWPLWFAAMFGIFYMTSYSEEDMEQMAEAMADGTIAAFFLLQIYAYGFRPYDRVRYTGAFPNSNITSLHYLMVYMMILFKLHLLKKRHAPKGWRLFFFLGAAGLLGFIFMTMGRTALVTAFVVTLFYGIFVCLKNWKMSPGAVMVRGVGLAAAFVLLFPAVFGTVRYLPTILHHPIWYEGEYSEDKVHSFDPADSPKYIEMDEFLDAALGRVLRTFGVKHVSWNDLFVLRVRAQESNGSAGNDLSRYEVIEKIGPERMDESLRIRLSIYAAYLRNLKMFGHPEGDGHYRIDGMEYFSWHAQNVWIQVAYSYGIPAGIVFLVLTVLLFRKHFRGLRMAGEHACRILPFFICLIFFVYGLMELDWNVGQLALTLLFLVQHPQMTGGGNKKHEMGLSV